MVYLGIDRFGSGHPCGVGVPGQGQFDAAAHGVEGLHYKLALLPLAQHLARRTGGNVAHARKREIAASGADRDEGAMGRELFDGALNLVAQLVGSNEGYEAERLV
jgi:hypothetical protein